MKLVIAEKPSVAISIAKVIGATKKKDGYYEGHGYKVSWCVGHLIQMANPDSYDEKFAISSSLFTIIARVGVCTLPTE